MHLVIISQLLDMGAILESCISVCSYVGPSFRIFIGQHNFKSIVGTTVKLYISGCAVNKGCNLNSCLKDLFPLVTFRKHFLSVAQLLKYCRHNCEIYIWIESDVSMCSQQVL